MRRAAWIARVGLAGFEDHYPHQLSGGMRKRVTLAQTFINNPEILLMDEPFSALDVQTRIVMQDELLDLWSSSNASVVFVTHDLEEAVALADRVYVLTAAPATVKAVYDIALPRPRVTAEIRYQPEFVELSRRIWEDLREEVRNHMITATTTVGRSRRRPDARQRWCFFCALAILVVFLGGWELAARTHLIDPFFFAMPSAIVTQLWTWITEGTSQGPLWGEVLVTLEETVLGFVDRRGARRSCAGSCSGATSCSRTCSASTSRSRTPSRASCWARSS